MKKLTAVTALIFCLIGFTPIGVAGETGVEKREEFDSKPLTAKWVLRVGGNVSTIDTRLAWAPVGTAGTIIIAESTLGLESETNNFLLGATYRFNRRHGLELAATSIRRGAHRVIDEEIEWGDYIYRAYGEVASEFDMSIIGLKYKYDFSDSGRLNAGFSVGLSTFAISASLEGEARIDDGTGGEWVQGAVEGASLVAPVPLVGFFLGYAITPKLVVLFATEVIDLDIGEHSGRVFQSAMGLEYAVTDLLGIGFTLHGIDLEYHSEKGSEVLGVDYRTKSVGAYLSFVF